MKTGTKTRGGIALAACLLLAACNQVSMHSRTASGNKSPAGASAQPAVRVKLALPFEAELYLQIPGGTVGKINSDLSARFDPPIHPLGSINSLSLYGKDIPLADKQLHDGMLTTVGFGTFEVLLNGDQILGRDLELRAFPADIEKLKKAYPAPGAR